MVTTIASEIKQSTPSFELQEYIEEHTIPDTYYVEAMNPAMPLSQVEVIKVFLYDDRECSDVLMNLTTNDGSFAFLCNVMQWFSRETNRELTLRWSE